jgi:hypothetical protein
VGATVAIVGGVLAAGGLVGAAVVAKKRRQAAAARGPASSPPVSPVDPVTGAATSAIAWGVRQTADYVNTVSRVTHTGDAGKAVALATAPIALPTVLLVAGLQALGGNGQGFEQTAQGAAPPPAPAAGAPPPPPTTAGLGIDTTPATFGSTPEVPTVYSIGTGLV